MDDRTFLSTVLAWGSGSYVNVHWFRTGWKAMPGRSCQTLDEAFEVAADLMATKEVDIYFCLSTQRVQGERKREYAEKLRAIWMDADVKDKAYASQEEAVRAIFAFCKKIGFPPPSFIVFSGGGVHVYWASDRDLDVDAWQRFADAFKAVAMEAGLKLDFGLMGNPACVLRFPSTQNWKTGEPRPVQLAGGSGAQYDFEKIFENIWALVPGYRRSRYKSAEPAGMADAFSGLNPDERLAEGIQVAEAGLVPFDPIAAGCGWLADIHAKGGAGYGNELWNLSILAATFMQGGHALAHEFSFNWEKDGKTYSQAETEDQWVRKLDERRKNPRLGWPSCKAINGNGAQEHCSKCPRFKLDKSPLTIGWEAVKQEQEVKELEELGGIRPPELRLPEGFCIEKLTGRLCAIFHSTISKGHVIAGRLLWLISNKLRDPQLQMLEGVRGIKFVAKMDKTDAETEVFLSRKTVYREHGLLLQLVDHGVGYNPDTEAMKMTEKFATSWLDKLLIEDTPAQRDPGTMGWRYEEGKIIGVAFANKLYLEGGEVVPLLNQVDEFSSHYMPMGGKEPWLEAAKLLTDQKRPELNIIIAVAFASPLTVFAGTLYGPVLVIWGAPGTAKSAAQQVGAATYGHPKLTRESLTSTSKSILKRLGLTKNLPSWWDDIQDERHLEALFNTMFVMSEGVEGGRLHTDASYKQRLQWQSILAVCANASFVEYLTRKQKSTTAGMRRVFEIEFQKDPRGSEAPGMISAREASQAFAMLEHNYGVVGMEYAKILGTEHRNIQKLVNNTMDRFSIRVQATGDEQFWVGLCSVLIVGASLAHRLGVDLDDQAMEEFLVKWFLENRRIRAEEGTEAGTYEHTERALTGFLNHYRGRGNFIMTNILFKVNTPIDKLSGPQAGCPIYFQIAKDQRCIVISRTALRNWLDENEIKSRQIYAGLGVHFGAREVRLTLGAGTEFAQTQEKCFAMIVKRDGPLYDILQNPTG